MKKKLKYILHTSLNYDNYQIEQIKYILCSFSSEISKLILLAVFFTCIGKVPEFIVSVICLLTVRSYTGGIHLKHYFSCLLLSFIIFFLGICILPVHTSLNVLEILIILGIDIAAVYLLGAVPSPYRLPLTPKQRRHSSNKAAISIVTYMYILSLFHECQSLYAGLWIITLQILQLVFAKINCLLNKGEQPL
ncbi:MAG: accessory gene regulator B family protein [Lachnospiraceae bacterium]|nr:accessory gene regulator B family protein [Lachnospiraceae bacterium]